MGPQLEHLGQDGEGSRVALVPHDSGVLIFHLAAPLADLGQEHGDGLEDVQETPIGTCMVSSEGACAAYYNFGRLHREVAVSMGRAGGS
jgi:Hydrogenase formation hypA family